MAIFFLLASLVSACTHGVMLEVVQVCTERLQPLQAVAYISVCYVAFAVPAGAYSSSGSPPLVVLLWTLASFIKAHC